MSLLSIRKKCKSLSGRFDLVNSDNSDNGMDFYINSGCRYLDLTTRHMRSFATYRKDITVGDYKLEFKEARTISKIWIYSGSTNRKLLKEITLSEYKNKYVKELPNNDQGTPIEYAVGILRLQPTQEALFTDQADFLSKVSAGTAPFTKDYHDIMFGNNQGYISILLGPTSDGDYTLTVYGEFYSKTLSNDNDYNFWSENYPELLISATLYSIEAHYRNTAGMSDWINAMKPLKEGLEFDLVEQQSKNITRIEL